jgi:superfamily II DNA or RNA helicase
MDIENKDIVLGMLQSLSMKDYPSNTFDSFGLTIVDEVHHISSEVFSQFLFKCVTTHTLGLSATMERKDGTTPYIKLFLGEVCYKQTEKEAYNVVVKKIDYTTEDKDFLETEYDMRGKVKYSTMITKICEYAPRSEFLLSLVEKEMESNPNQQMMIIAQNKSILKYLHDAMVSRNLCEGDVGYYVGGMKEEALKRSEKKRIIFATYSMAAEALDIKTLTTLLMASPKTDIEQAVGRILREKHAQPLVLDIVDPHSVFQNQWKKRKHFYKEQKYKIEEAPKRKEKRKHEPQEAMELAAALFGKKYKTMPLIPEPIDDVANDSDTSW